MAALEVVHRRLTGAGLADFCLILHSHKANKKDVLKALGNTLALNKVTVKEEALYQLEVLQREREKLNNYNIELHTPCLPLGKTIFEVNGRLAKLIDTPDVIFSLEDIGDITPERLRRYIYLLNEFVKTLGKMSEDYNTNPWRGSHVAQVDHELRHDIETHLRKLLPQLKAITAKTVDGFSSLSLENSLCFENMLDYAKLLELCSASPKIPTEWLKNDNIAVLIEQARDFESKKRQYDLLSDELISQYNEGFFALSGGDISNTINASLNSLNQLLSKDKYATEECLVASLSYIISMCDHVNGSLNSILSISNSMADHLALPHCCNIQDIILLLEFLKNFVVGIKPSETWFEVDKVSLRDDLLTKAESIQSDMEHIKAELLTQYDKEIFDIDYAAMLRRFRTDYTSFFKVVKKEYKADIKTVRSLLKEAVKKVEDSTVIHMLNLLTEYHEKQSWFDENRQVLASNLGGNFAFESTDYNALQKSLAAFDCISRYFNGHIPANVKAMLLDGSNTSSTTLEGIQGLSDVLNNGDIVWVEQTLSPDQSIKVLEFSRLLDIVDRLLKNAQTVNVEYKRLASFSKHNRSFAEQITNLSKLAQQQEIDALIAAEAGMLKENFLFLFEGINTDWDKVLKSLIWTSNLKQYINRYDLSDIFALKVISDDEAIQECGELFAILTDTYRSINSGVEWFNNLFDNDSKITQLNLYALMTRLERCLNDIEGLEEWIDFRMARENCNKEGLAEYISVVQGDKIDKLLIVDSFYKRLYRLWLDAVMPKFPTVFSFRRRTQEETIQEFDKLDLSQMQIARSRVKERLISNLPDMNRATSAVDEVGILKRELSKQRKIMPLRKLFRSIPTLLPALKPCLMMSPLSVSLFLQADNYNFDLVIFDEASQVCTEDAIGAIMRAKQVVIAGDNKQLPPTNFFMAAISDNDFDVDDEESDDIGAYESILDETYTILPERTLKWHYRSRHEHLIAFSNAKIYNHSLITFPAHIDKVPDNGVEYIHVKNGVYDRSGKRNNVIEAKKVAELVFEHFIKTPNRSLGIVTFSEAQQQAVDTAIRQIRVQKPQFEHFFSEEKNEPFFIKNLENVQGDERDTIIFSIGYAKDANGVMYMNLGPLSRDGGYRRLNVAITRAKFNIKLVGSIHPTDIKLESTNAEGVKMLRSYIEFAINGTEVLERELSFDTTINVDSPFEEAVYDFLVKKGYRVAQGNRLRKQKTKKADKEHTTKE